MKTDDTNVSEKTTPYEAHGNDCSQTKTLGLG